MLRSSLFNIFWSSDLELKYSILTYVDFLLYEILDINQRLDSNCLKDFDNLKQFTIRFESLEPIKNYMNSDRFMRDPLNGPMAAFGEK
ncbi:hypothetical protein Anas_00268 [Armadillidium nasatum]|uniref:Glutathione S-transferase C-terminal domain-containing protein n=1 Tax=Armadillidium nasatum TaxID=96803 RepID=A0A5N5TFX9_9CRUS|nr:hypothetical protein Anas_00268 [Armadillidium nasatum]